MGCEVICGDCREVLKTLADESVQMCVTSPPYWGLRDYGVDRQLGLEATPEEYVAHMVEVFREVRRVLRKDGTLWLNLGDSYASSGKQGPNSGLAALADRWDPGANPRNPNRDDTGQVPRPDKIMPDGLKPKDLVGIPWRVAFALQQPYYAGTIRNERDRIWLAAMIDGEGCMFIHKRKVGQNNGQGYERKHDTYGSGLEVANCHEAIVQRCLEITGKGSICHQDKESRMKNRNQRLFRWNLRSNECRDVVREIYPYLVGKQHEARLLCGCPSSGPQAEAAHEALILLHNGGLTDVDFPAPATMYEPGFYLRSDVIWHKNNPMPESVTDRPTKAHEYVFLFAKSAKYYYDNEAVKEANADPCRTSFSAGKRQMSEDMVVAAGDKHRGFGATGRPLSEYAGQGRNRRSVWTIATRPYSGAHFATFPEALVEPCILAGCPVGGVVLDPFGGAGTVGVVAKRLGRDAVLIDLNPVYVEELARPRIERVQPALEIA